LEKVRSCISNEFETWLSHKKVTGHSYLWRRLPLARDTSCEAIIQAFASMPPGIALDHLCTRLDGLTELEAASRLKLAGLNLLSSKKPSTWWQILVSVFPNPFNVLLTALAIISVATPPPNWSTFIILVVMIAISCVVRFWQEYRSNVAAIKLQAGVSTNIQVRRQIGPTKSHHTGEITIDEKQLVPGDILLINSGDSIPADCLLLETSNLQISQSRYKMNQILISDPEMANLALV